MTELEGRWVDIEHLIARDGPLSDPRFTPDKPEAKRHKQFLLKDSKILVIGAGGLGCELLKDLALVGFTNIDVIDMDTIDYSNLNRQFLFRPGDVKKPKAECAAAFINSRIPGCNVVPHYAKIQDKSDEFYQQFHLVVSGLDSIPARRWINETLCNLAQKVIIDEETGEEGDDWDEETIIPLVDGGTEGFMGQARVIIPHKTPCFECLLHMFPPDPLNFQECTLVSTPRQPQHCISWAMHFAWNEDPERKSIKVDGDDPNHIQWLFEKAELRAKEHGIEGVTYKLTQGVVKRIIPAIASTNAVISAACANEAFKLATFSSRSLKNWMMFNGGEGVYTSTTQFDKDEDCLICSTTGTKLLWDPKKTLEQLLAWLVADKDKFLSITNPSLMRYDSNGDKHFLHMTGFLGKQTAKNLPVALGELCEEGDIISITNRSGTGSNTRERNYVAKIEWTKDAEN